MNEVVGGSLLATAYHEAGHAVVAHEIGVGVRSLCVVPDDETLGRVTHFPARISFGAEQYESPAKWGRRVERYVMVSWAGTLAEQHATGDNDPNDGSDLDLGAIVDLAMTARDTTAEVEEFVEGLRLCTAGLLAHERVWVQVQAVAVALETDGTLTRRAFNRLCRETTAAHRDRRA
jgi:hypothetical protein